MSILMGYCFLFIICLVHQTSYNHCIDFHVNVYLIKKQPSCKIRVLPPKSQDEKICEIQGGDQEMAVMVD